MRSLVAAAALALPAIASAQIPGADQILEARTFHTDGGPSQAIWTPDGQYILVAVTQGRGYGSGIEVFHIEGDKLKRVAVNPLGDEPPQSIALIPNTRTVAVGISNDGVAFLPLDPLLKGRAAAHIIPQGDHPGSGQLTVTPDGTTLFVANELLHGGAVGVIALRHDPKGQLAPIPIGEIPTPLGTPGIALSPDGKRLYALNAILSKDAPQTLPGHDIPELQHDGCVNTPLGRPSHNGGLFVIDAAKASAPTNDFSPQQVRDGVLRLINAGCAPARVAVSSTGHTVYVTARGDNNILVFDADDLEHKPDRAFISSIPIGGFAPVGVALFDNDRKLLIANSSRFETGPGSAVVIDLTAAGYPILQTIPTGDAPRNITVSPDGRSLLLTVYGSDEIMILTMK